MEVVIFGPIKTQYRNYWIITQGKREVDVFIQGEDVCYKENGKTKICSTLDEVFKELSLDFSDKA